MSTPFPDAKQSSGFLYGLIGYLAGVATILAVILGVVLSRPEVPQVSREEVRHRPLEEQVAETQAVPNKTVASQGDQEVSKADPVVKNKAFKQEGVKKDVIKKKLPLSPEASAPVDEPSPEIVNQEGATPQKKKAKPERDDFVASINKLLGSPEESPAAKPKLLMSTARLQYARRKNHYEQLPLPRYSIDNMGKMLSAAEKTPFDPKKDADAIVEGVKTYLVRAFPSDSVTQVSIYAPRWWTGEAWNGESYKECRVLMVPCHLFDTYEYANYGLCFACLETEIGLDFFPFESKHEGSVNPRPPFAITKAENPVFKTTEISDQTKAIMKSFGMPDHEEKLKRPGKDK